jgi:hypothetical protein
MGGSGGREEGPGRLGLGGGSFPSPSKKKSPFTAHLSHLLFCVRTMSRLCLCRMACSNSMATAFLSLADAMCSIVRDKYCARYSRVQ